MLCPGPTGGLKRPPDPSPNNFAPPFLIPGYGPAPWIRFSENVEKESSVVFSRNSVVFLKRTLQKMGNGESVGYMRPSDIRFTHDSIQYNFRDGRTLTDTFRQLLRKSTPIDNIPKMEVMQYGGKWFVVRGNRRLFVLKELEKRNQIAQVQVRKKNFDSGLFHNQYTSPNEGRSVKIRGRAREAVEREFQEEWEEYQRDNCKYKTYCSDWPYTKSC